MPRVTRNSIRPDTEVKENIGTNIIETTKTPKKRLTKRKSPSDDDDGSSSEVSFSSPPKSSRSNSLSPFRDQFAQQLKLSATKDTKFRSARRALVDNSEFRLPGREKEVRL
jgi:hypothetical protein